MINDLLETLQCLRKSPIGRRVEPVVGLVEPIARRVVQKVESTFCTDQCGTTCQRYCPLCRIESASGSAGTNDAFVSVDEVVQSGKR